MSLFKILDIRPLCKFCKLLYFFPLTTILKRTKIFAFVFLIIMKTSVIYLII